MSNPHCTGPCQQGHRACPCPEACHTPDPLACPRGMVAALPLALLLWCLAALVALWLGW